jgi:hypothetical protein
MNFLQAASDGRPPPFDKFVATMLEHSTSSSRDWNVHFMPQSEFCKLGNGSFDFVGLIGDDVHDQVVQMLSAIGVAHSKELAEKYFPSDGAHLTLSGNHKAHAHETYPNHYTSVSLSQAHILYQADYKFLESLKIGRIDNRSDSSLAHFGYPTWTEVPKSSRNLSLQSKLEEPTAIIPSICAPAPETISTMLSPQAALGPKIVSNKKPFKFYLHEDDEFDFSDVTQAILEQAPTLDDAYNIYEAEHMSDVFLFQLFRSHPQRTYDMEAASLHVIAVPFYSSYVIDSRRDDRTGPAHSLRMKSVANAIRQKVPDFNETNGRNTLIYNSFYDASSVLGEVYNMIFDTNLILATTDTEFMQLKGRRTDHGWERAPVPRVLVIPYRVQYRLKEAAYKEVSLPNAESTFRNVSIAFHGSISREGGREEFLRMLEGKVSDLSLRSANLVGKSADQSSQSVINENLQSTAETLVRTRYCLVPSGDTPTSRRLFESLAAGCIPIVAGEFEQIYHLLPFRSSVDWSQLAIFAGDMFCLVEQEANTIQWLQNLINLGDEPLRVESQKLQKAFRTFLDVEQSDTIVSAILCELSLDCDRGELLANDAEST